MLKFGGWLAGILATVLAGYVLWSLTIPASTTTIQGMVYSQSAPVPRAMVLVALAGKGVPAAEMTPSRNYTDENGSYRFDFTGLPEDARVTLSVSAAGYRSSSPVLVPQPLGAEVRRDLPLTANVTAEAPHGVMIPHPPLTFAPHFAPHFIPKASSAATTVHLPH